MKSQDFGDNRIFRFGTVACDNLFRNCGVQKKMDKVILLYLIYGLSDML